MTTQRQEARRIPKKRLVALVGLVLVALLLVNANSEVRIDSYRALDQRTIVLSVAVAPRSWTRVTSVTETPTEVRVKVESLDWPIPSP